MHFLRNSLIFSKLEITFFLSHFCEFYEKKPKTAEFALLRVAREI